MLNDIVLVMQGIYFFVKFGLVLIISRLYRKKSSSILLKKICLIHCLHFAFEKHVPSQFLKDFSVENRQTNPRSIYLEFLITEVVF